MVNENNSKKKKCAKKKKIKKRSVVRKQPEPTDNQSCDSQEPAENVLSKSLDCGSLEEKPENGPKKKKAKARKKPTEHSSKKTKRRPCGCEIRPGDPDIRDYLKHADEHGVSKKTYLIKSDSSMVRIKNVDNLFESNRKKKVVCKNKKCGCASKTFLLKNLTTCDCHISKTAMPKRQNSCPKLQRNLSEESLKLQVSASIVEPLVRNTRTQTSLILGADELPDVTEGQQRQCTKCNQGLCPDFEPKPVRQDLDEHSSSSCLDLRDLSPKPSNDYFIFWDRKATKPHLICSALTEPTPSPQLPQPIPPVQPGQPGQPVQPAQPIQPGQPGQLGQPIIPVQPVQPGQPDQPDQPGQPGQPPTETTEAAPAPPTTPPAKEPRRRSDGKTKNLNECELLSYQKAQKDIKKPENGKNKTIAFSEMLKNWCPKAFKIDPPEPPKKVKKKKKKVKKVNKTNNNNNNDNNNNKKKNPEKMVNCYKDPLFHLKVLADPKQKEKACLAECLVRADCDSYEFGEPEDEAEEEPCLRPLYLRESTAPRYSIHW